MTVRLMNVPGLSEPPGYSHVAVATGATLVFTAGQVPLNEAGELVGKDDSEAQARQVIANLLSTLEAAGAAPDHVVKTTVYVAADHETQLRVWQVVRGSAVGRAPSTLLGVSSLGYSGQLVEIEAVAVLE